MSHNHMSNTSDYSSLLYILIAIMSIAFGYVVGKNDKEDHLNKQQQIQKTEIEQLNSNNEAL